MWHSQGFSIVSITGEIGVVIGWIGCLSLLQRGLNGLVRTGRMREFTARKTAHITVGLLIVPLAILVSRWQLAALPVTMILAANTKANLARSRLGARGRRFFPLFACAAPVALILYCWSRQRTDLVVLAVLAMTIGDTAAALVGMRYGRHKVPWTGKTLEGAAANFVTSFATLALAGQLLYQLPPGGFVAPAAAAAVLEASLAGEWDNPLAIMLVLVMLAARF
jgi:dolichol kinase